MNIRAQGLASSPAFPRAASEYTASGTCPDGNDPQEAQQGMSLRMWLAGQALAGLCANPKLTETGIDADEKAMAALIQADAILDAASLPPPAEPAKRDR